MPLSYRKFAYFPSLIPQYYFLSNEIKSLPMDAGESSSWKFIMYREPFPFRFITSFAYAYAQIDLMCRLSGARKILILFIIGMFADICLIAIGLNAYKHRS